VFIFLYIQVIKISGLCQLNKKAIMLVTECIREVRAFNRFYTAYLGVLDETYLNEQFSLAEIRVLHAAMTSPGITSAALVSMLNIDKSYLSRMVIRLRRMKLLIKKKSGEDGRAANLFVTAAGKKEYQKLDRIAAAKIRELLHHLGENEYKALVKCMTTIREIFSRVA
jgi:DNA-binding MarR family transcriptional regulator